MRGQCPFMLPPLFPPTQDASPRYVSMARSVVEANEFQDQKKKALVMQCQQTNEKYPRGLDNIMEAPFFVLFISVNYQRNILCCRQSNFIQDADLLT